MLNSYAVLDFSVAMARLAAAAIVIVVGVNTLRGRRQPDDLHRRWLMDRYYLLSLLGVLTLVLNLASWPLTYMVWQSYVPEWPGAMCIYGIVKIGEGSLGAAAWLPGLAATLQITRPALVFLTGAWLAAYLVNRQTRTAPLLRRGLFLLVATGVLGAFDSGVEAAYLAIPKREVFHSSGCCTVQPGATSKAPTTAMDSTVMDSNWHAQAQSLSTPAFFAVCAAMAVAPLAVGALWGANPTRWRAAALAAPLAGAAVSVPVGRLFLTAKAAPAILGLPYHHCAYCLLPGAPEAVVGIVLFLLGAFAVGWACVAAWLGTCVEARPHAPRLVRRLLGLGSFGYAASALLMAVELALAAP